LLYAHSSAKISVTILSGTLSDYWKLRAWIVAKVERRIFIVYTMWFMNYTHCGVSNSMV
jgi:hypothetical protein